MAIGFGVLGLAPAVFWSMTIKELEAAVRGRLGSAALHGPLSRRELDGMMAEFPDRGTMDGIDVMDRMDFPSRPSSPSRP